MDLVLPLDELDRAGPMDARAAMHLMRATLALWTQPVNAGEIHAHLLRILAHVSDAPALFANIDAVLRPGGGMAVDDRGNRLSSFAVWEDSTYQSAWTDALNRLLFFAGRLDDELHRGTTDARAVVPPSSSGLATARAIVADMFHTLRRAERQYRELTGSDSRMRGLPAAHPRLRTPRRG